MGQCHCTCRQHSSSIRANVDPPQAKKRWLLDDHGFLRPWDSKLSGKKLMKQFTKMSKREEAENRFWKGVCSSPEAVQTWIRSNKRKAFNRISRGVSQGVRVELWYSCSHANQLQKEKSGVLRSLSYEQLLKNETASKRQIDVDVVRTMPEHCWVRERAAGQHSLQRVLHALAVRLGPKTGYVQGMNMIVSLILVNMGCDEELAFWTSVAYMEHFQMRQFYEDGMVPLQTAMKKLDRLIQLRFPRLHEHLRRIDIDIAMFASPWFLTLFVYNLSFRQSTWMLDAFFLTGIGDELVYRFGLEYIGFRHKALLHSKFEGASNILSRLRMKDEDFQRVLRKCLCQNLKKIDSEGFATAVEAEAGDVGEPYNPQPDLHDKMDEAIVEQQNDKVMVKGKLPDYSTPGKSGSEKLAEIQPEGRAIIQIRRELVN